MKHQLLAPAIAMAGLVLGGCVALPADRGAAATQALVESRSAVAARVTLEPPQAGSRAGLTDRLLGEPMGADEAVQVALLNNPSMRLLYARLGLAQSEVFDATRLSNPSLGYLRLTSDEGSGARSTWSIAQNLTELLYLGYRNRVGRARAIGAQQTAAHEVLRLEAEVREAFYAHAGAQLSARMRDAAARTADASARLAARFHDAGNITLLQRSREEAAASEALIGARQSNAAATAARGRLLTLMGLNYRESRARFVEELGLPVHLEADMTTLQQLGERQRLDLAAGRTKLEISLADSAHVSRWRWLGRLALNGERERDADGSRLEGAGGELELPLFNSGKGRLLRAAALSESAAAEVDALKRQVGNDIAVRVEAIEVARRVVEEYRTRLIPLREGIVHLRQREQNFMLIGAFDVLAAKREEVDTYEAYINAVRDYWIERTRLARAVGGALPGDESPVAPLELPALPPQAAATSIPGGTQ